MSQRFEGKSVEEALGQAAEAFGVDRYRLTYHVVVEKRGFLGGVKRVVIEAEVNEAAAEPPPPPPMPLQAQPAAAAPSMAPPRAARPPRERAARGPRRDRDDRGGGGNNNRDRGRGPRRSPRDDDYEPFEEFDPEDVPVQGAESDVAKSVRIWCEDVIRLGRFDVVIRTDENETQINVRLYGRDARRFLDRDGELLDALQVLSNKALVGRRIEKDIELDCSGFKERRNKEIGEQAREIADRVRRDGREQLLPAMSPIERRIVHLALQDDADVMTESRGDGFFKRVAIKPRGQQATTTES